MGVERRRLQVVSKGYSTSHLALQVLSIGQGNSNWWTRLEHRNALSALEASRGDTEGPVAPEFSSNPLADTRAVHRITADAAREIRRCSTARASRRRAWPRACT